MRAREERGENKGWKLQGKATVWDRLKRWEGWNFANFQAWKINIFMLDKI